MTDSIVARTVKEFCKAYGVGKTKAYELMKQGKLEVRKMGRKTLITEASARQWHESLSTNQPTMETRISANVSEPQRKRQYHKSRVPKDKMPLTERQRTSVLTLAEEPSP